MLLNCLYFTKRLLTEISKHRVHAAFCGLKFFSELFNFFVYVLAHGFGDCATRDKHTDGTSVDEPAEDVVKVLEYFGLLLVCLLDLS